MSNLLLDMSGIKTGGGAQLALNFLKSCLCTRELLPVKALLISDRFPFLDQIEQFDIVIIEPSQPFARIYFEVFTLPHLLSEASITHTFTFFGPGLPRVAGVRQVVGVAYPTLVYDEAIYWRRLPLFVYFRQKILNGLRKQRLRRADHLIFETDVMMARAQSAGLVRQGVSVIPPTPTAFLTASALHSGLPIRILFLCGADYHKNLPRLLDVLPKISEADLPVIFMVSLSREDFRGACRKESFPSELVDRYFEFIGSVPPDRIQQYYDRCTFVGNISDLESFSNNYMEAWLVGRPILASDRDFSRAICGDSAVYVEPHDPDQFFEVLKQIACGDLNIDFMVQAGAYRLSLLPTMEQRVRAIANVVFTGGL